MRYDSIIFDLDGTLWDMSAACVTSYNRVVKKNSIPFREITSADLRQVVGKPHNECINEIFAGLSPAQLKILDQQTAQEDVHVIREEAANLYPGVIAGLAALAKRYPLFIVSNCQAGYIEAFYETSHLKHLFKDQECYGNTGQNKAQNIARVIKRNGLEKPIYVGDTDGDGKSARANGLDFLHVGYGFASEVECDFFAPSFDQVVKILL